MSFAKSIVTLLILCLFCAESFSQQGSVAKVHFLYGSKPLRKYKDVERKWFGGILGGHVGIEVNPNEVLNFMRRGRIHWFASVKDKNSRYAVHTSEKFWQIFRTNSAVKKATVVIPITNEQRQIFDSLSSAYQAQTPYDYAFFGMRCGAAAYDILARMKLVKRYSHRKTWIKIFYPKKLRKRLLAKAKKNDWQVLREEGGVTRRWERD